ncbi:hypothetical protein CERSUDRAFT_99947 [Gelatoporia subvermispora B]|uniref:Uncharacterized protein n=1 Tax=Ceriporiopsis subvermispora (strain B) TaxID=914234 RepID=M2R162_CERS8|nr:hypothetical protein CERSUDRAFT_99947 [Gelatoporia subvermispora B]
MVPRRSPWEPRPVCRLQTRDAALNPLDLPDSCPTEPRIAFDPGGNRITVLADLDEKPDHARAPELNEARYEIPGRSPPGCRAPAYVSRVLHPNPIPISIVFPPRLSTSVQIKVILSPRAEPRQLAERYPSRGIVASNSLRPSSSLELRPLRRAVRGPRVRTYSS